MRRRYKAIVICALIILWAMDSWAFLVSNQVQTASEERITQPLQHISNPLVGNITLDAKSIMWEGVPCLCGINMTLAINSRTPLDLTIDDIQILFTSSYSQQEVIIGSLSWGGSKMMSVANATGLQIWGQATIRPPIPSEAGNYFIGVYIVYLLRNHTLESPNTWVGGNGALNMIQISLVPAIFQIGGWNAAFWLTLLAVCVVYLIDKHYQFL